MIAPLKDAVMLQHLTTLHESVEATKSSMIQTQEVLSVDMNTLLSKLDQAIDLVKERGNNPTSSSLLPQQKIAQQQQNPSLIYKRGGERGGENQRAAAARSSTSPHGQLS